MALNFPTNPTDGQTYEGYVYDATAGVWNSDPHQIASRFVTSATAPPSPSEGDGWFDTNTAKSYVYYDGVWVQLGALGTVDLNQIADVNVSSPANGESLVYDGTDWVNQELQITSTIQDLTDTTITNPQTGDSIVYDGTDWVNGPQSSNAIINGDFGVWQRGTSFTGVTSDLYTADRWIGAPVGNSTFSITRESFTPGDIEAIGYGDAEYFLRFAVSTGDNFTTLQYKVDDVRTFSGQTVTLSFWAKGTNTGNGDIDLGYLYYYGTGGSQSVSNSGGIGNIVLSSSWQRFSKTFTIDSVAGKTIGEGSYFLIRIGQDGGNTSTEDWNIDIWGVQLEAGSVATPFRLAGGGSKAAELALCKRYYQKSFLYETAPFNNTVANTVTPGNPATTGGYGTASGTAYNPGVSILEVEMRSTPSVQLYTANGNISSNNFGDVYNKNNTTSIPASVITDSTYGNYTTSKRIAVRTNNGSGITNLSNPIGIHWTADAEL